MGREAAAEPSDESFEDGLGESPDLGLFSTGGPFESFPGPVLIAGRNGLVLGANAAAEGLAALLQSGETAELREIVNSALAGKAAQINPLLLDRERGRGDVGQAFDLIALPWADAPAALLLGRDVTLERSLRAALIESRQRFKDLVDASSDFAWETDSEGRFCFVSDSGALGYAAAQMIGQAATSFLAEGEPREPSMFESRVPIRDVDVWFRDVDGSSVCLRSVVLPLVDSDGIWRGSRGLCRDVTLEREREAALARAHGREQLFARVLRILRDEADPGRMLEEAAVELARVLPAAGVVVMRRVSEKTFQPVAGTGEPLDEAQLLPLLESLAEAGVEDESEGTGACMVVKATRYRDACNGALCVHRAVESPAWGDEEHFLLREIAAYLGAAIEQDAREEELERLSTTDPLTGLLNRRSFLERVERRFLRAQREGRDLCLFYLDLDNFKRVNDEEGHERGDVVLRQFSDLLRSHVRERDLAGRLGGDEFGLFIEGIALPAARERGEALLAAANALESFRAKREPALGLSIGIAGFDPGARENVKSLLVRADQAMYRVKRRGKQGVEVADPPDWSEGVKTR